jgi:hypothetical protein
MVVSSNLFYSYSFPDLKEMSCDEKEVFTYTKFTIILKVGTFYKYIKIIIHFLNAPAFWNNQHKISYEKELFYRLVVKFFNSAAASSDLSTISRFDPPSDYRSNPRSSPQSSLRSSPRSSPLFSHPRETLVV